MIFGIIMDPSAGGGEKKAITTANSTSGGGTSIVANPTAGPATAAANKHFSSVSSLGDASGVALLLGNHAKFGLAERCW